MCALRFSRRARAEETDGEEEEEEEGGDMVAMRGIIVDGSKVVGTAKTVINQVRNARLEAKTTQNRLIGCEDRERLIGLNGWNDRSWIGEMVAVCVHRWGEERERNGWRDPVGKVEE